VPRELLGRVSSLDWVTSYALIPLSFALTGPVAAMVGARATLIGAGAIGLTATAAFWLAVPALRARDAAYAPSRAGGPGSTASASAGG
jgi:hypothetical protein